jgi:hypothetical protein
MCILQLWYSRFILNWDYTCRLPLYSRKFAKIPLNSQNLWSGLLHSTSFRCELQQVPNVLPEYLAPYAKTNLGGNRARAGVSLTMRSSWDLPELDGPAISTTLPGRSGARWSGGGRRMGGRVERERERKAAAVSSTASHSRGPHPASPAMARVLESGAPVLSFPPNFFDSFWGARLDRLWRP